MAAINNHTGAINKLREHKCGINNNFNIIYLEDGEYKILNEIKSDGEIVVLPNVTHIGYEFELISEAHIEGDYHHFKTTYCPAEYRKKATSIIISENIKKIIIKNDTIISEEAMKCLENVIIEIIK